MLRSVVQRLVSPTLIGFLRFSAQSSLSGTRLAFLHTGEIGSFSSSKTADVCISLQNITEPQTPKDLNVIGGCVAGSPEDRTFHLRPRPKILEKISLPYGDWELEAWDRERLEFESDLDDGLPGKLLDCVPDHEYMKLWGYLLNYRFHSHGLSGVDMYWRAILRKDLHLPVTGVIGNKLWSTILELGFKSHETLEQIIEYANKLLKLQGIRWIALYDQILEHFVVHGNRNSALKFHRHLFPLHPPGARRFRAFFREVLHRNGDVSTLKTIYGLCPYRNVYSGVISLYCKRGEFKKALDWHFYLLENGDLPSSAEMVEPIIKYFSIHDKQMVTKLAESVVDIGIKKNQTVPEVRGTTNISSEFVNKVHGKTFGIREKQYNDELGARWFATSWVSVDTAIRTIHALGIQEIGPLSLQAIALRDQTAEAILYRINQLRDLGISIGNSMFAKSIEHFSRNKSLEFLNGLIHSDQHPDQLDNQKLQNELLVAHSKAQDWEQFYRTLEIRSLAFKNPMIAKRNLMLQTLFLDYNDISPALDALEKMIQDRIPIKPDTISHILTRILSPRRRAHRPSSDFHDLNLSMKVLYDIMRSGSKVPVYYWREIIRRLGMLGKLDHIENLSLMLARWYMKSAAESSPCTKKSYLPADHPLHPTRILFNNDFQRAVIAWGFIHQLGMTYRHILAKAKQASIDGSSFVLPDLTFGINLLKKLRKLGVFIDGQVVSRAIVNRLLAYFGPGESSKEYNRVAQMMVRGRLREVASQIDNALGSKYFLGLDLPTYLRRLGSGKLLRLESSKNRAKRKVEKFEFRTTY